MGQQTQWQNNNMNQQWPTNQVNQQQNGQTDQNNNNKCERGSMTNVIGSDQKFMVCVNGEWVEKLCAPGTIFDTEEMICRVDVMDNTGWNEVVK